MRYSPTDLEKKQLTSLWNGSCDRNSMWLRVAQVDGQQESRNLSSTTARNEILPTAPWVWYRPSFQKEHKPIS